jgi:hypothetical protein
MTNDFVEEFFFPDGKKKHAAVSIKGILSVLHDGLSSVRTV